MNIFRVLLAAFAVAISAGCATGGIGGNDASPGGQDATDGAADEADAAADAATDASPDAEAWDGSDGGGPDASDVAVEPDPQLGWVPLMAGAKQGSGPGVAMKESTTRSLLVNFDIPGFMASKVDIDGQVFHRVSIPGFGALAAEGKPELPVVGTLVEIPHNVTVKLSVYKSFCQVLDHYRIYPAQKPQIRGADDYNDPAYVPADYEEPSAFLLDQDTYGQDARYPGHLSAIEAGDIGIMRGHRLLLLRVNPLQYNPVTRKLDACSNIEIKIEYDKSTQVTAPAVRLRNPDFEHVLDSSLLHYFNPRRMPERQPPAPQSFGCDYLIITHADFYDPNKADNPVMRLADWKRHKGLRTMVVTTESIKAGATENDIAAYIKNAYQIWGSPPAYILLVGDSEFVPTFHVTPHANHTPDLIGSDSFYVTVDGDDYFPDIYIGRLSVDTVEQATDLVDKIIAYEQAPPDQNQFYNTLPLVNLFEDVRPDPGPAGGADQGDGLEEPTFRIIEFADAIRTFLVGIGRTVETIWAFSGKYPSGPSWYQDGTDVPVGLTLAGDPGNGIPGFPWNGNNARVLAAINAGRSIVTFNAHGGRGSWGNPQLTTTHVTDGSVASPGPVSVYLSYACQTGWFDNETDNAVDTSSKRGNQPTAADSECLLEELTRLPKAGAAGAIGSSRISWEENDFLFLGAFKALFPAFNPNPPGAGALPQMEITPIRRMDPLNLFTKIYMASRWPESIKRQSTFEMYHVFGDPEMTIWAEKPGAIEVNHPGCIGATGLQNFVVRVTEKAGGNPVRSARVAVTDATRVLYVAVTDADGIGLVQLDNPPQGSVDLTVTHITYRPYLGKVAVTSGGAHFEKIVPDRIVQGQGVTVQAAGFQGNETVSLNLDSTGLDPVQAENGLVGHGQVAGFAVPVPFDLGLHNLSALGQTSGRCAVDLLRVQPETTIDLYTYNAHDQTTWHLYRGGNPTWNSPNISFKGPDGSDVASNNLVVGNTYTVRVRVFNDSDLIAEGATASVSWADFGAGQPEKVWEDGSISDPGDIPARGDAVLEAKWTPIKTGHICLRVKVNQELDVNLANNVGQENCHVGPTASPAEAEFRLWNPTEFPAMINLELRQLTPPGFPEGPVWGSSIVQPDPQLILPGESRTAKVVIDPDMADTPVPAGTQVEFALTAFINGNPIGGANFAITKKPCPTGTGCVAGCVPFCDGKQCGWDGCEGHCGKCADSQFCQDGSCVDKPVEKCGNKYCGSGEDCKNCPLDCGKCACPPDHHDNGLGECVTVGVCALGFKVDGNGDCKLEPYHLPFTGSYTDKEGVAAWWADGTGLEPSGHGHSIPAPYDTCLNGTMNIYLADAYQYIASPDYPAGGPIRIGSPGAAHGVAGITGFPYFRTAMAGNAIQPSELEFSFGYMTIGNNIPGVDWTFAGGVETRYYTGGTFTLKVQG
ncbi:MAG: C25 family cysteine peptidase, partial [Myxococcota bacterium]